MFEWIKEHETVLYWAGGISLVMFIGSLIMVPILVARMDADYFMPDRPRRFASLHPALHVLASILKNIGGVILVLCGIVMLFVPGQGLLTILFGLMMIDFPGKVTAERRLFRYPPIKKSIDWIRAKAKKPPLNLPPPAASTTSTPSPKA